MAASQSSILRDLLSELRFWRAAPSRRELINRRPPDREEPDPTPIEMPIGYERPPTMAEQIQRFVRQEVSAVAADQGFGSFEEEDDFEVDDEDLPIGQYDVVEYELTDYDLMRDAAPPEEDAKPSIAPPPTEGTPEVLAPETEPPKPKQHWE